MTARRPILTINATPEDIHRARRTRAWFALSAQARRDWPICHLRLAGCTRISTTADHIIPATIRPDLFFEPTNIRGACKNCNDLRRDTPINQLGPLRDPKYDRRRKHKPAYARRRIASHRRPSRAAAVYFGPP